VLSRDDLVSATAWAARAIASRPAHPILAGARLEWRSGEVSVGGFDYEMSCSASVKADSAQQGSAIVPGRLVGDIARLLPAADVEFYVGDGRVTLTCGTAEFEIPQLPSHEYPTLPTTPSTKGHLEAGAFASAVAQVAVTVGRDDTLPVMTAMRLEFTTKSLTMLATDRYRLSLRELPFTSDVITDEIAILVPARNLSDVAKMIENSADSLVIGVGDQGSDGVFGLACGGRNMTQRLIGAENQYPKVRSIFRDSHDSAAEVSTSLLMDAVRRVALVAEARAPVRLTFTSDALEVRAGAGANGAARETIPVTMTGPDVSIAFNPGYLIDALNAVGSESVRILLEQPSKPAEFVPTGDGADMTYRHVVMPVRGA
jgi:DNA polymerase III subunit beta